MQDRSEAQLVRVPKTADEARQQVDELKIRGVDGIKAILESGFGEGMLYNRMDVALFRRGGRGSPRAEPAARRPHRRFARRHRRGGRRRELRRTRLVARPDSRRSPRQDGARWHLSGPDPRGGRSLLAILRRQSRRARQLAGGADGLGQRSERHARICALGKRRGRRQRRRSSPRRWRRAATTWCVHGKPVFLW